MSKASSNGIQARKRFQIRNPKKSFFAAMTFATTIEALTMEANNNPNIGIAVSPRKANLNNFIVCKLLICRAPGWRLEAVAPVGHEKLFLRGQESRGGADQRTQGGSHLEDY